MYIHVHVHAAKMKVIWSTLDKLCCYFSYACLDFPCVKRHTYMYMFMQHAKYTMMTMSHVHLSYTYIVHCSTLYILYVACVNYVKDGTSSTESLES